MGFPGARRKQCFKKGGAVPCNKCHYNGDEDEPQKRYQLNLTPQKVTDMRCLIECEGNIGNTFKKQQRNGSQESYFYKWKIVESVCWLMGMV